MKIVSDIKKLAMKSSLIRTTARNVIYGTKKQKFIRESRSAKINDKLIVFGAYNGRNYACSPKAIYEYMLSRDEYKEYLFVWFFDHPEEYRFLERNRNTRVVSGKSKECEKYLHRAKYWIFNFRAMDYWIPKEGQTYVQCWHGTPLKRLGYDIVNNDNAMNSIREIRQKYRSDAERFDYMVSPCDFVTERFTSAWNLEKAGKKEAVLKIGYPRNDFLVNYDEEGVKSIKEKLNLKDDRKIILYAPTWRDNQHDADKGYTYDNPVDFNILRDRLEREYVILFRAHYLVADKFNFAEYENFVYDVSSYDDINELYVISDILITDYSSVFFDYAILERPMIFYMYDMEEYRDEMRGFYITVNDLPGPIVRNEEELIEVIDDENIFNEAEMKKFNMMYNEMNDGHAAERLVERVISI